MPLEVPQHCTSGERQVEIEFRNLLTPQVLKRALVEAIECDGGIEVVEDPKRTVQCKQIVADRRAFGSVTGCEDDVRLRGFPKSLAAYRSPVRIKLQIAVVARPEVTMVGVIGNVFLVKDQSHSAPMKRAQDGAIRRCVPVSPGR